MSINGGVSVSARLVSRAFAVVMLTAMFLLVTAETSEAQTTGELGGLVATASGDPVADVIVDYFEAQADSTRGTWLGDERTNNQGEFNRTLQPGCYVLVAIAPDGTNFPDQSQWYEAALCIKAGETTRLDIQLNTNTNPGGCVIGGVSVDTTVTGPECAALVALFNATGGPEWVDNTGWATPTDPCTWSGITCEAGQVAILRLRGNNLVGELPPAIGDLTGLRQLFIMENSSGPPGFQGDLRGVIPAELAQLNGLEWLELSNNRFTGPLPAGLGQLTNLRSISVRGNQLTGDLPPDLGQLTALENLQLDSNQFTGPIPAEYGQLDALMYLDVQSNQLTGPIPSELGELSNLEVLQMRRNSLTGSIPSTFGQLSLRAFNISGNLLAGDITEAMSGLRASNPNGLSLDIVGTQRTNCFSVSDPDLAAWIQTRDSDWQQCTP